MNTKVPHETHDVSARKSLTDVPEASVDSIAASGDTAVAAKFLFEGTVHTPDVIAKFWKCKSVLIIEQLVSRDANTYLQWARDLGFDGPLPDRYALGNERKLVDKWVDSVLDKRRELWERYIPKAGPVKTVQGQLLYAMTNIDNTCRTAPNGWDVYLSELEGYVFGEVDVRSNFTHLVASAFVNDASELTSSLPLPGRQQCASYYEFLKPTAYITRLDRMWLVVLTWIERHPKPKRYSGHIEQKTGAKVDPQEPYKCKPPSRKMPKLDRYAEWAIDLGFDREKLRGLDKREAIRRVIDKWVSEVDGETSQLWRDLVPARGPAAALQGELIRAHGRIGAELYRNGMMNWDKWFRSLLDLISVTLSKESSFSDRVRMGLALDVAAIECAGQTGEEAAEGTRSPLDVLGRSFFVETDAESALRRIGVLIVIWVRKHPEPIAFVPDYENLYGTKVGR